MFIKQEDILSATRGGLDIILSYYPQAEQTLHTAKKQFKIRDEKTPSATLREQKDGNWIVTDFGGDQSSRNAIQTAMFEDNITYREALVMLAGRYNVGGISAEINKPTFKKRPATEEETDGVYLFDIKKEMSEYELKTLGEKVTAEVARRYNVYALNSFSYIKNREAIETYSNENYPIFLFEYGEFKKIYQPNSYDKAYRFRYSGIKPKDFIFGIKQVISMYNTSNRDDEAPAEKLDEIIIASGERDALNLSGLGYAVVWFNSETAVLSETQIFELRKYAKRLYLLPDLDKTGVRAALRHGLAHLDLHLIWLPDTLTKYKDKRGNPRKDFSDWVEMNPKSELFKKLLSTACPLRFYDIDETEKGVRYNLNNKQMFNFLAANGFYRIDNKNEKTGYSIVNIKDNVVHEIEPERVKEFVIKYCQQNYLPVPAENMIHRSKQLSETSLISLPSMEIDFTDYTADKQYMFFENAIWEVTANEIKDYKPGEIEKYVWSDEVLKHRVKLHKPYFTIEGDSSKGFKLEMQENDSLFLRYLIQTSRVHWRKEIEQNCTDENRAEYLAKNYFSIWGQNLTAQEQQEQIHHLINKIFAIGYLLHRYKDKSRAWLVFAMDNKLSEQGKSNGRSGKSITFESLFHLMKNDVIGGRNKDVFTNNHVFENITEHTDYLLIDDAHEYLDFDFLFDKITGSMPVNPKHTKGYKLPFEKSPKIAITSNHGLKKMDGSTSDRILFTVYSDWYHATNDDNEYHETRKPVDEFGKILFGQDYTENDWNADLNFFAQCIQFYLSRRSPEKINPPMSNVTKRNLLASIGQNFNDWANGYFTDEKQTINTAVIKQEAFNAFTLETNLRNMTMNKFSRNIKDWCKIMGYIYNPVDLCDKNGRLQKSDGLKTHDALYIQTVETLNDLQPPWQA